MKRFIRSAWGVLNPRGSLEHQEVVLPTEDQLVACRHWAEKNGYDLVGEYVDEAESGRAGTRPGFKSMIRDALGPRLMVRIRGFQKAFLRMVTSDLIWSTMVSPGNSIPVLAYGRVSSDPQDANLSVSVQEGIVPAAIYTRASGDHPDGDLSVSAQRKAIRDWATRNGYVIVREYTDKGKSRLGDDKPGFSAMIRDACQPKPDFQVVLVLKFSRFSRSREHAIVYKTKLRARGVRVISVSEPSDDAPTGRLLEGVIEALDQFYSENLSQEVFRGMRWAAMQGHFFGGKAPFGYTRVTVSDGARERPTLEESPEDAEIVREIFRRALDGWTLGDIVRDLNRRGLTKRGRPWTKSAIRTILANECYTGVLVWGRTHKGVPAPDPVRVEGAWPAIVSKAMFDKVQQDLS